MLLSMTGFGEGHVQRDGRTVWIEIKSSNSRFFKCSIRTPEGYGALEPLVEAELRKRIRRGTILATVRVERAPSPEDFWIDVEVLERYRGQLEAMERRWGTSGSVRLADLLPLPGVVRENEVWLRAAEDDWAIVREALEQALTHLDRMRQEEGQAMAEDLLANCRLAVASLAEIQRRAPLVVEDFRCRLQERMEKILAEFNVTVDPADLVREVGLFADRIDISEEIVRFRSHLEQFEQAVRSESRCGRKLEFLTQEMIRESNTMGSKVSDVEAARHVIELKATVERIREMIQNVE